MYEDIIVYTANIGDMRVYDPPRDPHKFYGGVHYIYFHSPEFGKKKPSSLWDTCSIQRKRSSALDCRWFKINPHIVFKDAKFSIWMDANINLVGDPVQMVEDYLGAADIAVVRHPDRTSSYHEVAQCVKWEKDSISALHEHAMHLRQNNYPETGHWLACCFLIIRRHTPEMVALNEMWWEEINNHSCRDQISFPYVCWSLGIEPAWISGGHHSGKDYRRYALHQ